MPKQSSVKCRTQSRLCWRVKAFRVCWDPNRSIHHGERWILPGLLSKCCSSVIKAEPPPRPAPPSLLSFMLYLSPCLYFCVMPPLLDPISIIEILCVLCPLHLLQYSMLAPSPSFGVLAHLLFWLLFSLLCWSLCCLATKPVIPWHPCWFLPCCLFVLAGVDVCVYY